MLRRFALIAVIALVAACATPPTYAPAAAPGGVGYSETQVESNRFFVSYRASGASDAQVLQDFALLRAAELALQHGRDWFWVDRRTLDEEGARASGASIGIGIGGGNYSRRGGVNLGIGITIPIGGAPAGTRARGATVEIRLGEGVKPDDANAFDAHAISANIRARLAL